MGAGRGEPAQSGAGRIVLTMPTLFGATVTTTFTPTAGVLSGQGAAPVYARYALAPVPQITPAALADVLSPVRSDRGQLVDYELEPAGLLGRSTPIAQLRATFMAWRSTFIAEERLCDRATVLAFADWAGRLAIGGRDRVAALRTCPVRLDPASAAGLSDALRGLGAGARASSAPAVGLADPARPGLVRGFLLGPSQQLLALAGGGGSVHAAPGRLLVRRNLPGDDPQQASAETTSLEVLGWSLARSATGLSIDTPGGPVACEDTVIVRLLTLLAPVAAQVKVVPVPVTSVFAPLLTTLAEMAGQAAVRGTALTITT